MGEFIKFVFCPEKLLLYSLITVLPRLNIIVSNTHLEMIELSKTEVKVKGRLLVYTRPINSGSSAGCGNTAF